MKTFDFLIKAIGLTLISVGLLVSAAESADNKEPEKPLNPEKLVANQPVATPAASIDPAAEKPMTINFSDFVKDGAGCGVPNLDTSGR
jgi:hypothetical protein